MTTTIPQEEFARRRRAMLDAMTPGSVALIPAAAETTRNADVHHPFRQDSDFQYLTGFPEPDAIAVLKPGAEHEYQLLCRPRDPLMETWNGRRAGPAGAEACYSVNKACSLDDIDTAIPELLANCERVYYAVGRHPGFDAKVVDWVSRVQDKARTGVSAPVEFVQLGRMLSEMRLIKSPAEIDVMREAGRLSAEGHCRAMQACKPGMMEYAVEAEILHTFNKNGAGWAYPSIVGGGANACILHYTENNMALNDGDVLLIDAGAEVEGYAGDITRSFPVNGKFSDAQRELYEVVLTAQLAAIEEVGPGKRWNSPHDRAVQVLTEGLVKLGLLEGPAEVHIEDESYKKYYMHRTGHWLGMDVHDVGDYKVDGEWREQAPGMVMTIEPGLYIAADTEGVDPRWWNIGIRIEDDVLVTSDGYDVLTSGVPKSVDEIEALMRG